MIITEKILFVCTGNTCRSPMAQAIANELFRKSGAGRTAESRGINVLMPSRASDNAVKAVRLLYELDLTRHISRQISPDDLEHASLVLTMTRSQKDYLNLVYGGSDKIMTFREYAGAGGGDVADPFGGDIMVYQECARQIHDLAEKSFAGGR